MPGVTTLANRAMGAAVKALRAKQQMTQQEVADRINRSQRWVSMVERGQLIVGPDDIVMLAKGVKVTPRALVLLWVQLL